MPEKINLQQFIDRSNRSHKFKYNYSKVKYINSKTKVTIICPIHGEFLQRPEDHYSHECPRCGAKKCVSHKKINNKKFLKKCNKFYKNKYKYNLSNFESLNSVITITCPKHGNFEQKARIHFYGSGCKKCSFTFKTNKEFIKEAENIHGKYYDYSKSNYIRSGEKVIITCPKHGDFERSPKDHIQYKLGCHNCLIDYKFKKFIIEANLKHKNKYNYSLANYIGANDYIKILCPIHGEFNQKPSNHLTGHGCSECAVDNTRSNLDAFIEKANKIHNNKYDYSSSVYISRGEKIKIICADHGVFYQTVRNHLNGAGCAKCWEEKRTLDAYNSFIKESILIHKNKYNYSLVNYKNSYTKVIIICGEHGNFHQSPAGHIAGHGCPKCDPSALKTTEWFIEQSNKIHNNKYDYSLSKYKGLYSKIEIICKSHGSFWQLSSNHIRGSNCPKCFGIISKPETKWLDSHGILPENRNIRLKGIGNKNVDGYDPITNTVYEFHGDYWHGNPNVYNPNDINKRTKTTFKKLYDKTIEKENIIKNAGYNLITIWEQDYNNLIKSLK